jgi:hypothetical protein
MSYPPLNDLMRQQGNRSRAIPNIGQGPSAVPMPPPAQPPQQMPTQAMAPAAAPPQPMRRPPTPFTVHPPGEPADPHAYNYEPQEGGAWKVYPPGVPAPNDRFTTALPHAASTGDYKRMSQTLSQLFAQHTPQQPTF